MQGWYVAKTKPQKEKPLIAFLSGYNVESFFPEIMVGKRSRPLFPTYLFCYVDPKSQVWPIVHWAPGLSSFLNCENIPTRVPQEMIDYLRERTDPRQFVEGERVVIMAGPFKDLEGVFQERISGKDRCRILVEMVRGLSPVELPRTILTRKV